jgi:hypothetical protein
MLRFALAVLLPLVPLAPPWIPSQSTCLPLFLSLLGPLQLVPIRLVTLLVGGQTGSTFTDRNIKTYYGWQAMLAGMPLLLGALIILYLLITGSF